MYIWIHSILATVKDAFRCFIGTEIDLFVIGNYILRKQDQDPSLTIDYKSKFLKD